MSTISVPYISSHKEYAKSREKVQKMVRTSSYSSRHDLGVILGVSGLLFAAVLVALIIVPIVSYNGASGSLPAILYLAGQLDAFNIINTDTDEGLFYYYVAQSIGSSGGGILFAVAFWQVAKSLKQGVQTRNFMMISVYGFVLLYISIDATVSVAAYPPFGIATLSSLPLASYLIFFGLNSSAISLSHFLRIYNASICSQYGFKGCKFAK